jgi:hypothetical protein
MDEITASFNEKSEGCAELDRNAIQKLGDICFFIFASCSLEQFRHDYAGGAYFF